MHAGLEWFLARQYLDPYLRNTGQKSFKNKQARRQTKDQAKICRWGSHALLHSCKQNAWIAHLHF